MKLKVTETNETLTIKNDKTKTTVIIPYDDTKSYFKNVLSIFTGWGVVDYISIDDGDIFEIKELKGSD